MIDGCQAEDFWSFLSEELLSSASRRETEFAWRKKDLLSVAAAAEENGLASAGWKGLFRTPDGDLELCWNSFYPEGKDDAESWPQYAGRTWEATRKSWRRLFGDKALIEEGRKLFRLLQETETPGTLPSEVLWFILYFTAPTEKDREPEKGRGKTTPEGT